MTVKTDKMIKNEDDVRILSGDTYFSRGFDYYIDGAVQDLLETADMVKAIVAGTHDYHVIFGIKLGQFQYGCDCPVGQSSKFCKHLVAAALAWLEQQEKPATGKRKKKPPQKTDPIKTIKDHLADSTKDKLINIIIEQAENDPGLRNQLLSQALRSQTVTDIDSHKAFIHNAINARGFIDYSGMRRYIRKAWPAVNLLEGLLKDGDVTETADLADYALRLGFTAYGNVDDSDGNLGDILYSIAGLHLEACIQSRPDPKQLAKSLFKLEMKDDWGIVHFEQYEKLLGKDGLKQFKQLAEKEWQKVPAKKPTGRTWVGSHEHGIITRLMERIARLECDVESLIAIKKRDLSMPYYYYEIATIYAEDKRHDEALQWAEKGFKKFKNDQDSRLNEFLITEYQRRKQHDNAMQIAWHQLTDRPSLDNYRQLKTCADKTKTWEQWRTKALQWLRKDCLPQLNDNKSNRWRWGERGHSLLVEIFLWEKDMDSALKEAKQGGCVEHLWMQLAKACEKAHSAEALKIYQDRIEGIIRQTSNDAYDRAADMLRTIKKLMQKLKQQKQFTQYIAQLRMDYKQKRNFIKRIERI